jgi:hypothetical protein
MIVKILQFGSNWWARFGRDPNDPYRFTKHAAYYNSSGVLCGSKMRRHWAIPGLIRFNGTSDFNPNNRARLIGQVFDCSDLKYACGGNRLLFHRRVHAATVPDYYQVVVSSDRFGICDFESPTWKADAVEVIAASDLRSPNGTRQEALLLMPRDGWVASAIGTWKLWFGAELPASAALQILDE